MTHPAVEAKDLVLQVGHYVALEGISFSVPSNSFFSVIGPNGAGKTVLMKSLLGIIHPIGGDLQIFGSKPSEIPASWIGYVPQIKTLDRTFPALAIELVVSGLIARWPAWIRKEYRDQAMQSLERVHAQHLANRSVATLSGGELQRVYLARSMIISRKIMILDEPATGIDFFGESDLYVLLEEYQKDTGATIIMVTHDTEVAKHHSSHVLVLNRKQIAYGPPDKAMNSASINRAFGHSEHEHIQRTND